MLPFLQESLNSKNEQGGEGKEEGRFQKLKQEVDINYVKRISSFIAVWLFSVCPHVFVLLSFKITLQSQLACNSPSTCLGLWSSWITRIQACIFLPHKECITVIFKDTQIYESSSMGNVCQVVVSCVPFSFYLQIAYICCSFMSDFYYIKDFHVNLLVLHDIDFFTLTRKVEVGKTISVSGFCFCFVCLFVIGFCFSILCLLISLKVKQKEMSK